MNQSIIWDRLYEKNLSWNLRHQINNDLSGKKVLELGVGSGKLLKSIVSKNPSMIIGVDFSKEAVKRARSLNYKSVRIMQANIKKLPFKDNSFDVVFCYFILNNLYLNEREKAVQEIHRVLKPYGLILFRDFYKGDLRQKGKSNTKEKNTITNKSGLIVHFFSTSELKSLFFNFKKVKINVESYNPFKKTNEKRKIVSLKALK